MVSIMNKLHENKLLWDDYGGFKISIIASGNEQCMKCIFKI